MEISALFHHSVVNVVVLLEEPLRRDDGGPAHGSMAEGALQYENASRARAVVVVAAESEVSDLLYMRICVESIYARDFQSLA